jgi:hypothetical protein
MASRETTEAFQVAEAFHDTYERLAPQFNYKTRRESAVPWEDVDPLLQALMMATVRDLVENGVISIGPRGEGQTQ